MRRVAEMPPELQRKMLEYASALHNSAGTSIEAAYREMADDEQREHEAHIWSEALIGDIGTDPTDASR